jgi:class 3 adenylate cyclase
MFLTRLLDLVLARPETEPYISEDMDRLFGRDVAVFIADMSGFSRITETEGVFAAMLQIRRFQIVSKPIVETHGGEIVKMEADDIFAIFPNVKDAVSAAKQLASDFPCSIGIGYGRTILFDKDMWGDEVNQASRLGEDTAKRGEVLLSASALAQMMDEDHG